jgi:hypothetical protein
MVVAGAQSASSAVKIAFTAYQIRQAGVCGIGLAAKQNGAGRSRAVKKY